MGSDWVWQALRAYMEGADALMAKLVGTQQVGRVDAALETMQELLEHEWDRHSQGFS